MRIAEVFESIQGEGLYTGTPSVFVRTTGCNLRCWFCDTRHTSWEPEGYHSSWRTIVEKVCRTDVEHVVLTGGEPLLQPDVVPLTAALTRRGRFITIETAGTVFRPVHANLMSVSPKLAGSGPTGTVWLQRHEQTRNQPDVVRRFLRNYVCQFKFVIDQPQDVADVKTYVCRFDDLTADHVWLMPQATTREEIAEKSPWIETAAARCGYKVSRRLHVELFGNGRGR